MFTGKSRGTNHQLRISLARSGSASAGDSSVPLRKTMWKIVLFALYCCSVGYCVAPLRVMAYEVCISKVQNWGILNRIQMQQLRVACKQWFCKSSSHFRKSKINHDISLHFIPARNFRRQAMPSREHVSGQKLVHKAQFLTALFFSRKNTPQFSLPFLYQVNVHTARHLVVWHWLAYGIT